MLKTVLAAAVVTLLTGAANATSYGYGGGYDVSVYQPDFVITAYYDAYYSYDSWGEFCYTDMGLVGPGEAMPLGADCSVWTPYGELSGYVTQASDYGYYCRTQYGDVGPSPLMAVGSWCIVNTSYGEVHGYIIG